MQQHNQQQGLLGEEYAIAHLRSKGMHIRHVRWRYMQYELDIVAEQDGVLVVVEVKTRSSDAFGYPENAVKSKKHTAIKHATEAYLETYDWSGEVRFDIIAVIQNGSGVTIDHFEDAFYPGL